MGIAFGAGIVPQAAKSFSGLSNNGDYRAQILMETEIVGGQIQQEGGGELGEEGPDGLGSGCGSSLGTLHPEWEQTGVTVY